MSLVQSAPIGPIHPISTIGHCTKGTTLLVANVVGKPISILPEPFELRAGDIIRSGTPENVGPHHLTYLSPPAFARVALPSGYP